MPLADLLYYASGFAVEPYEIINLLEQFGGINPTNSRVMSSGVDVFQIETRNPHLHEEKGDAHIEKMLLSSLGAMCRSPICPQKIKSSIIAACASHGFKTVEEEPPCPIKIRPPSEINLKHFAEMLKQKSQTLTELG
jgi:mannosyl-3-phosphoglycerate synthase